MIRIFLLLIMLLPAAAHASDLVARVQGVYQKNSKFQADFVQKTHIALLEKDIEEPGNMIFSKPGNFMIHYRGKQERKYICNGATLWIYHPKEQEAEVYPDIQNLLTHEALAFLGGLGQMTKEFQVRVEAGGWLSLVPRNKSSPFMKIRLRADPVSYFAQEIVLYPRAGNESHYQFSDIRTNPELGFQFNFVPPAGVAVSHPSGGLNGSTP